MSRAELANTPEDVRRYRAAALADTMGEALIFGGAEKAVRFLVNHVIISNLAGLPATGSIYPNHAAQAIAVDRFFRVTGLPKGDTFTDAHREAWITYITETNIHQMIAV